MQNKRRKENQDIIQEIKKEISKEIVSLLLRCKVKDKDFTKECRTNMLNFLSDFLNETPMNSDKIESYLSSFQEAAKFFAEERKALITDFDVLLTVKYEEGLTKSINLLVDLLRHEKNYEKNVAQSLVNILENQFFNKNCINKKDNFYNLNEILVELNDQLTFSEELDQESALYFCEKIANEFELLKKDSDKLAQILEALRNLYQGLKAIASEKASQLPSDLIVAKRTSSTAGLLKLFENEKNMVEISVEQKRAEKKEEISQFNCSVQIIKINDSSDPSDEDSIEEKNDDRWASPSPIRMNR